MCSFSEQFEALGDFEARFQALLLLHAELVNLMGPGGNGKINLSCGNPLFAGIAVHGDEIAGKARKVVVFDFAYATMRHGDDLLASVKCSSMIFPVSVQAAIAFLMTPSKFCHFLP